MLTTSSAKPALGRAHDLAVAGAAAVVGRFSGFGTARYRVRALVGGLWLIAAGLQLQPFMFTREFSADVLGTAALSQPTPLGALITSAEHLVTAHPVFWNWPFALIELVLGAGLVLGRRGGPARLACLASIGWGAGVWLIGEGAGGLFTGHAALPTGAPGAALLYVLVTIAAWPRPAPERAGAPGHEEAPLPVRTLSICWLSVWLVGAALSVLPAQRGASGLSAQAAMGWMMSPSWTVRPALALTTWLHGFSGPAAAVVMVTQVVAYVVVAAAVRFSGRRQRLLVSTGAALALAYWVFGQGFGGLSTGTATDVGTGPLIVLLGAALMWSQPRPGPARPAVNQPRR